MTEETAPAELIEDFGQLYPRQVAYNRYRVLSLGGDQGNTHYEVNIEAGTCTCPDMKYNEDPQNACKHLALALFTAPGSMSADQVAVRDIAHYVREIRDLVDGLDAGTPDDTTGSQGTAETSSEDAQDDAGEDGGQVNLDAGPGGDDVMSDVSEWFAQAAGFAGFDPSIIDLSWAEAEARKGIAVERQPFSGGYYDDGEWQDKDGFDEERETAGDLLSSRDEFQWYGEPDYVYFIPEADVAGLVE